MKSILVKNNSLITSVLTISIYILYSLSHRIGDISTVLMYSLLVITLINIGLILVGTNKQETKSLYLKKRLKKIICRILTKTNCL